MGAERERLPGSVRHDTITQGVLTLTYEANESAKLFPLRQRGIPTYACLPVYFNVFEYAYSDEAPARESSVLKHYPTQHCTQQVFQPRTFVTLLLLNLRWLYIILKSRHEDLIVRGRIFRNIFHLYIRLLYFFWKVSKQRMWARNGYLPISGLPGMRAFPQTKQHLVSLWKWKNDRNCSESDPCKIKANCVIQRIISGSRRLYIYCVTVFSKVGGSQVQTWQPLWGCDAGNAATRNWDMKFTTRL